MRQTWNTGPCSCTGKEPWRPDRNEPAKEALGVPNCASSSSSVMEAGLSTNDVGGVLNSLPEGLGVSRNLSPPGVGIASKSEEESVSPVQTKMLSIHRMFGWVLCLPIPRVYSGK